MRFLVSPDGSQGVSIHPLDKPLKEHEGWHDCTDLTDQEFDEFVTSLQREENDAT